MTLVMFTRNICLAMGLIFFSALAAHAAGPDFPEIIKYRKSIMKSQREHMAAASAIIHGKVDYREQLADHVRALESTTKVIAGLFPSGSDVGDTGALEAVWSNRAEFDKRALDTQDKARALVKSVNTGDTQNYSIRLNELLDSCKSCHKEFRKKEQK